MNTSALLVLSAALTCMSTNAPAQNMTSSRQSISYHTVEIQGLKIFYREAGRTNAPTVLLLHGFPSSSRMWEPLLPLLADKYHLIAPDYPGFGNSSAPSPSSFEYTFDNLARVMGELTTKLRITNYQKIFPRNLPVIAATHRAGMRGSFRRSLANRPQNCGRRLSTSPNIYEVESGDSWHRSAHRMSLLASRALGVGHLKHGNQIVTLTLAAGHY